MRAIAAGLVEVANISGFLGIDELSIKATLAQLREERYAVPLDDDGNSTALTERGRAVLASARESSPQNETLVFLYDRLLLKAIQLSPEQWLFPQSVDPKTTIEVRPYPAEGPVIADLSLPDVTHVLEQEAGGRSAFGRDILRFNRIVRKVRLCRPGVALVYKKLRAPDLQLAFVVDDVPNLELEHAFASRGGPKKMGFIKSVNESATMAALRKYVGPASHSHQLDGVDLDERRIAVSIARFKRQTALARSERSGGDNKGDVDAATAAAVNEAEDKLGAVPSRPLAPYEPAELLELALEKCRTLLMISSRTVDRSIVNEQFTKRLSEVLRRGARVIISLTEPIGTEPAALDLERLRARSPRLELNIGRRRQFNHLICDDRFAVISNKSFLGNQAKMRSFQHVVGYILQRPHLVRAFASRLEPKGEVGSSSTNAID